MVLTAEGLLGKRASITEHKRHHSDTGVIKVH